MCAASTRDAGSGSCCRRGPATPPLHPAAAAGLARHAFHGVPFAARQPPHLPAVPAQAVQPRLGGHVPHNNVCVLGPASQQRPRTREAQRRHLLAVAAEGGRQLARVQVPQPDLGSAARGGGR